ncbi:hypothetical protein DM02DRAFT_670328 [Periconia macrospinosa]|uniref:DUF7703 domain-containing protein n=1 Tax=Periconia macrospinosa TaxID=97972 RepID=A0A2V1DX50_9PLEO|nr:hypothetical protein DM02DRAFT_670328 [Periconia macrospinosa]
MSTNATLNGTIIHYDFFDPSRTIPQAMTAFTAIAWFNAAETLILIFLYFKRYQGLYFWSILLATAAVVPYATGAWMKQYDLHHSYRIDEVFLTCGWVVMVTGQALVLYSRLHLVCQDYALLRFVFWMIVFNASIFIIPTLILDSFQFSAKHIHIYNRGYFIMEKIEMTAFAMQELFISGIYLWEVWKMFKVRRVLSFKSQRSMWQLLAMNLFHFILDITLLIIQFMGMYQIQATFKGLVYSVSLKIEFAVLNSLVESVRDRRTSTNSVSHVIPKSRDGTAIEMVPEGYGETYEGPTHQSKTSLGRHSPLTADQSGSANARSSHARHQRPNYSDGSMNDVYPGRLGKL